MLNGPAVLVTVQGVCSNVRRSQGQKYLEKAGFFALRPSSISSEMIEFHKKYSLPSSQRLIFRGLARGYLPLNAYKGIKVIPLLLEECEIHPRLAVVQYLDFRNQRTGP